jgi:hypothetical protein
LLWYEAQTVYCLADGTLKRESITLMGKQKWCVFAVLQKYCRNANKVCPITCLSVWLQTRKNIFGLTLGYPLGQQGQRLREIWVGPWPWGHRARSKARSGPAHSHLELPVPTMQAHHVQTHQVYLFVDETYSFLYYLSSSLFVWIWL